MKNINRIIIVLVFISGFSQCLFAQGNCVKKGTILVDAYYGFPYFNGALLKAAYKDSANVGSIHNLNHFAGRVEYMVNDKMGVGIEATYATANIRYIGRGGLFYTAGVDKLRVLGKMSFHFATSENIDPYLTWGLGYKNTNLYTTEPGVKNNVTINVIPLAFRVGIGMRYFFSDIIGVNAEVGLGGPLMQAGISAKF